MMGWPEVVFGSVSVICLMLVLVHTVSDGFKITITHRRDDEDES